MSSYRLTWNFWKAHLEGEFKGDFKVAILNFPKFLRGCTARQATSWRNLGNDRTEILKPSDFVAMA